MYKRHIPSIIFILLLFLARNAFAEPNLVGHWKLDGDVQDSSGNSQNGVLYGGYYNYRPDGYFETRDYHSSSTSGSACAGSGTPSATTGSRPTLTTSRPRTRS